MTKKIRVRMIDKERWYSAFDLGGCATSTPLGGGLDTAPHRWLLKNTSARHMKMLKGMIYLHEKACPRWLDYVEMRELTVDIRKAQSIAAKARSTGIGWKKSYRKRLARYMEELET